MVRLVFRPYTQLWRTICTSVSLRTSIRVSPDFILVRHSSPSFGSQAVCSNSNIFLMINCPLVHTSQPLFYLRLQVTLPTNVHTYQTPWSVFQDGISRRSQTMSPGKACLQIQVHNNCTIAFCFTVHFAQTPNFHIITSISFSMPRSMLPPICNFNDCSENQHCQHQDKLIAHARMQD